MLYMELRERLQAELDLGPSHDPIIRSAASDAQRWLAQTLNHITTTTTLAMVAAQQAYAIGSYRIVAIQSAHKTLADDTTQGINLVTRAWFVGMETLPSDINDEFFMAVDNEMPTLEAARDDFYHTAYMLPIPVASDADTMGNVTIYHTTIPANLTHDGNTVTVGGPQFEELFFADIKARLCRTVVLKDLKLAEYWENHKERLLPNAYRAATPRTGTGVVAPSWL